MHRISTARHSERLLPRLKENERIIDRTYNVVTEMVHDGVHVPPAGEWLLDNYYIIKEHISLAREHLPKRFSKELPLLDKGPAEGFPRIYHLATELITHVDGRVDLDNLSSFIASYQRKAELTIGELWAIPIVLRLTLIENLRRVAQRLSAARNDCALAEKWAKQLVQMAEKDPQNLVLVLADMVNAKLPSSSAFVAELCRRLQGQSPTLALALSWFEQRLAEQGISSEQLILSEGPVQALDQVSIGNTISSLRLLSAIDWREFVERHSVMEAILRAEPAGIYPRMDFETRDAYRHTVERIAKKFRRSESDVARRIVEIARDAGAHVADVPPASSESRRRDACATASKQAHIGYYLVDKGLKKVAKIFGGSISSTHPAACTRMGLRLCGYLLGLLAFTALLTAPFVLALLYSGISVVLTCVLSVLFAVCASQAALHILNSLVVRIVSPQRLPQMDFSAGIPDGCRTMVVIPTMLTGSKVVDNLIEGIEIRYLANRDDNIFFALLTDFSDAAQETEPGDAALVTNLQDKITALNIKYASDRPTIFFLYHRPRRWNEREGVWMGTERKRGKLCEFNRALRSCTPSEFGCVSQGVVTVGDQTLLPTFKYVITLDTDTQLPRNAARRMAAAMAHPLNRPVYDAARGRIVEGYGLLQPRVALNLSTSRRTFFARLNAPDAGVDPYTRIASDVYQDLFGEGSFVGKGIYDIDAFDYACGKHFPENRILSHDLIEGCYARSGLLTDAELYEDFPARINADIQRRHRWMRGDWQIAGWLLPWPPHSKGNSARNALSALSRWKILDNLRRSVVAPCAVILLAATWLAFPKIAWQVSVGVVALTLLPALLMFAQSVLSRGRGVPRILHLHSVIRDLLHNLCLALMSLVFLASDAILSADAIVRTGWRLLMSRRKLLEWTTASDSERKAATTLLGYVREMSATVLLTLLLAFAVIQFSSAAISAAVPLLALWLLSPLVAYVISIPRSTHPETVGADDRLFLREIARRTWRFFSDFVTPEEHWLPPDNFQQTPKPLIASRTSPTNMGAALLSTLAAFDFGYLSAKTLVFRLNATLQSMASLPRYQGHFFNWYNTRTCQPLIPNYVSSVDSGNLLSYLLVLRGGLSELHSARLLPDAAHDLAGLADTVRCLQGAVRDALAENKPSASETGRRDAGGTAHVGAAQALLLLAAETAPTLRARVKMLARFIDAARLFHSTVSNAYPDTEVVHWADAVVAHAEDLHENVLTYAPWLARDGVPASLGADLRFQRFEAACSLKSAAELDSQLAPFFEERLTRQGIVPAEQTELTQWREEIHAGAENARQTLADVEALSDLCTHLSEMNFDFLFDRTRLLLAIGYNASDQRLDGSFYDLLASEARVASYVGIALGKLPPKHWFMLGRKLTASGGDPALLSWSGSMFEYLMPALIMPSYEGSLLDQTKKAVVKWQIDYAAKNGIPWGISESGFSARDIEQNYQYRAFGVPGLGFKRGLSEDLVIAPYASVMALMVAPRQACANLRELAGLQALNAYGFFEAIDYTASRLRKGQKLSIVRSFMAHHQGMSMLALTHFLLDKPMQRRFSLDPRLRATDLLLQERVPRTAVPIYPHSAEEEHLETKAEPKGARIREFKTPDTASPEVQLLSNGRYHVMLTSAGGGYSRCKDLALTRWSEDGTCDPWGQFCYIRDVESGRVWSATHQPTLDGAGTGGDFLVHFGHSSAEFRRQEMGITTHLDVCVSPEDDVELRLLKVANASRVKRRIEVVTYAEVVLNTSGADQSHPAFSNLFVQTEIVKEKSAILCTRRPRGEHETPVWLFHQVTFKGNVPGDVSFETDRAKFIGRGGSLKNPLALRETQAHSGTCGSVLDPIVSVRRTIELQPMESVELQLVTGVADSRAAALGLVDKFQDYRLCERAFEVSWTNSKVVLSQLNADESDAQVFCELAAPILFASPFHRAAPGVLARNKRNQSGLWGQGISGDYPIVLLRISDVANIELAREALKAHAFLRMKGLAFDLVIWNEDSSMYRQSLHDELMGVVMTGTEAGMLDKPGGIFIRRGDQIAEEDRVLLQTLARVTLQEGRGRLEDQIQRRAIAEFRPPKFVPTRMGLLHQAPARPNATPRPFAIEALKFFNGTGGAAVVQTSRSHDSGIAGETPALRDTSGGGFSRDGREYILLLKHGYSTPAPWCNVIANSFFGTVISESGSAYSWAENAHEYRLTPWHNDAVLDGSGECFYLRDEETGYFWSPTPKPVRGESDYRVRHGFGYSIFETVHNGIRSEMTVFVVPDAPVKIVLLKLRNESAERRVMTATAYWEWVLGEGRPKNAQHVVTEPDRTGAIYARNAYNTDFQSRVSFCTVSDRNRSVTCDRAEFIGRNGRLENPAAMRSTRLSGRVGAGLDPCTVFQVKVDFHPGEERWVAFALGAGKNASEAQALAQRYQSVDTAQRALERVRQNWRRTLGAIQIETPDPAFDTLANGWLIYQVLSCRVCARSGFYQSGGAYGFRDQLQDVMALTFAAPELTREHVLRCAARQFEDGDVQHWWHPPVGRGVRTKFSDDYLWLPYAVSRYVLTTGDTGVLSESAFFSVGRALKPEEEAYYDVPHPSDKSSTLYEHCKRALTHALQRMGQHGLPLMGCGDWNDGMNLVGIKGQGESVWLAFFLHDVLTQFGAVAQRVSDASMQQMCEEGVKQLRTAIGLHAWDGNWYLRAFFDNGQPLGSASNPECQIDSLPQSWAVLSKAGDPDRCRHAMNAVFERLVHKDQRLIQLFTPPFDKSDLNPGYIKAYVPGVRENGGQYTHAAIWAVMAFAELGDVERAWDLLRMLNPINHGSTAEDIDIYKVEPYVMAADVYALPPHTGRGGWTWYTGSAGWMYRLMIETLLGIRREVNVLKVQPRVPKSWKTFSIQYRFRETLYRIKVERTLDTPGVVVDGVGQKERDGFTLQNDGREHNVVVKFSDEKPVVVEAVAQDAQLQMAHA
ncbi:MAG TPA: glucoamylase family protein [Planctomycetota bacterium]|nr:glucoamylase family protein [Planctomycetota bacterium]